MDEALIIPAAPADAAAMAALHAQCFEQAWDDAAFARLIAAPASMAFVARDGPDGGIGGFLIAFCTAGEAEILSIGVALSRRRKGLARRLVQALMELAQEERAERLYLEVAASNEPAIGLYRGLGFESTGRRRGYYAGKAGAPPEDAIIMSRTLSDA